MMPTTDSTSVCQHCKALCCRLVTPPVTEKERQKILSAGHPDFFEKISHDLYKITSTKKNQCPYLNKQDLCSIHSVKPRLCTLWPVVPYDKNNKKGVLIIKCPLHPYLSEEFISAAIKDAENIPLHIIKQLWKISEDMKEHYKRFEYQKIEK